MDTGTIVEQAATNLRAVGLDVAVLRKSYWTRRMAEVGVMHMTLNGAP